MEEGRITKSSAVVAESLTADSLINAKNTGVQMNVEVAADDDRKTL